MSKIYSKEDVLILGGTGMLGASLIPILEENGHSVAIHGHVNAEKYNADLSEVGEAFRLLEIIKPSVIVNLVGLTDVDQCEAHPSDAFIVNVRSVENITAWIKSSSSPCHLIHISTDQVYDGSGLHKENDVTLTNYYAFSKYSGELAARNIDSTILRTNFFGCSHCNMRNSLTDWLFHALTTSEYIQVFEDVLFNPLSMITLSEFIGLTIHRKPLGVFNLGSQEGMSKADFAFAFADELNLSTSTMKRTSTDQVDFLKTYRPKDMRTECSKFESTLGVKLPSLNSEIKRVAREYNE